MPMLMFWSVPRGRSTAFYRMMTERGDVTCFFEPFSHAEVFGQVDIGGRSLATVPEVLAELRSLATTQTVFIKDTTDRRHPAIMADQRFWAQDAQHTFLIRHPRETLRSYLAVRRNPRIHELGFEAAYELYAKVSRLTGRDPLVIDAGDLMRRPAQTVEAYCARAGLKFRPDALSWQPSDRPEWQSGFSHCGQLRIRRRAQPPPAGRRPAPAAGHLPGLPHALLRRALPAAAGGLAGVS
jgi:hypothetical protein